MPLRTVSLVGHSGVGKTTLSEALLHHSGAISRTGRVEDGNTVSDFTSTEKEHGFSVQTSALQLSHGGTDITLLDTPGYADFVREIRGAVRAADAALVLVGAVSGVEVGTERAWATLDRFSMPRVVGVSHMDRERADFYAVLADLRASLGGPLVPLYLPLGGGGDFTGLADVLRADPAGLPGDVRAELRQARNALTDAVIESDDGLMARFLDGEDIPEEDLQASLSAAIHHGRLYPVLPLSAASGVGVPELLGLLSWGLRSARERGPVSGTDGQTREPRADAPFSARVWRVSSDPFVGKRAYLRVWSGTVRAGDTVLNSSRGEEARVAHLYVPHGAELREVPELGPGMVGVLTKVGDLHTGDTLCDPAHPITFDPAWLPEPVHAVALRPKTRQDEDRLGAAMARLREEDPTLHFEREGQTGEQLLSGMGEMHLNIAVERLAAQGVNVDVSPPRIPYRETIRTSCEAQGKHKKQTGGHGQYGDCRIRIEPGEDFAFTSAVVGGSIPAKYLPSIEKGIEEAMQRGPLAGFPLQGVHVTVLDGSHHDVDSSDIAFRQAGALALRNALEGARPCLLEPVQLLRVRAPAQHTGDLIADLQARRARVQGMDVGGTVITVSALVPQRELQSYSAELRSLTGGRGGFSVKPAGYQELPAHLAERVIEEARSLATG